MRTNIISAGNKQKRIINSSEERMTLKHVLHAGIVVAITLLAGGALFFLGNQRLAQAAGTDIFSNFNALQEQAFSNDVPEVPSLPDPPLPETNPDPDNLVEEELCKIYTDLNEAEFPIQGSDVEPCGGQGGDEPPPPPPDNGGGG